MSLSLIGAGASAARLDCAATSNGAVISSSETDSARADVEGPSVFPFVQLSCS